ncbi:hypothetical protein HU200_058588 [Digitaria exilis]|uniref:Uncharacterized protein n=1 Tax=Digitaria exilis TaxID=1010633 RepID=A0A835ADD4_9POAL|nr:hypothetical protein HU200_058588 [Digitaria exilis]
MARFLVLVKFADTACSCPGTCFRLQEAFSGAARIVTTWTAMRDRRRIRRRPSCKTDGDLVELLWHNGSVIAQPQANQRPAPSDHLGSSGLTGGEETAAWFPDTLDDALEKDLYTQLWYSTIADAAPHEGGTLQGPSSQPPPPPPELAHTARPAAGGSGVESSWAGDICSTFCGSNQVPRMLEGVNRGKDAALQSEAARGGGAHDGAGTSSSGQELLLTELTWPLVRSFDGTNIRTNMFQIMWMTSGMAPMIFPGAHQFMSPMALGMNSACIPVAQGLNQMPRYMTHPLPNHIPLNPSPAMNPMNSLNVTNQMQNVHLREASNHFLHPNSGQTVVPQVPGTLVYGPEISPSEQHNRTLEVPASTVVPTSRAGQPHTYGA